MPEPNKFLLSALAQDPLISSSLVPKNPQKDETVENTNRLFIISPYILIA